MFLFLRKVSFRVQTVQDSYLTVSSFTDHRTCISVTNVSFHPVLFSKAKTIAFLDPKSIVITTINLPLVLFELLYLYTMWIPSHHTISNLFSTLILPTASSDSPPPPKDTKDPYPWLGLDDPC